METNLNHMKKNEMGTKSRLDLQAVLEQDEIAGLLKELRICSTDDGGMKMMKGIYSLSSYIQSIVAETMQKRIKSTSQIVLPKGKFIHSKSREFIEEYPNSEISENDEEDEEDNGIKRTGDLDSESPMPIPGSVQYSSKFSRNTLSPGRKSRFMMSPFLKSIISNNLSATRYNNLRKHTSLLIDDRHQNI